MDRVRAARAFLESDRGSSSRYAMSAFLSIFHPDLTVQERRAVMTAQNPD